MSKGVENTADVVIGHSNLNTNRITVTAKTDTAVKMEPINFSANYLREILNANKEINNGTLEVSSKGLSVVKFLTVPPMADTASGRSRSMIILIL